MMAILGIIYDIIVLWRKAYKGIDDEHSLPKINFPKYVMWLEISSPNNKY